MNSSLVLQPLPSALHNSSNTEGGGWCARLDEFMTVYIRTYCAPKQLQSFIHNNIVYAKTVPNPITHTMKETSYKVRCVCFTNATVVCLTNHCRIGEIEDYSHDSWINVILEIIHRVNNFKKHIATVYIYITCRSINQSNNQKCKHQYVKSCMRTARVCLQTSIQTVTDTSPAQGRGSRRKT